jgi:hypothetical protein
MTYLVILAKDAKEVAMGEKDGSRPPCLHKGAFLPKWGL